VDYAGVCNNNLAQSHIKETKAMKKFITHIGMDTDSQGFDIAIAEGFGSNNHEVRSWGRIAATLTALDKLIKQLRKQGHQELRFVYEAGPCGYGIYRHLQGKEGIVCVVVAPSRIPRQPGERVKTNRRDARKLARLDRSGDLEAIYVPSEEDEAMRDLSRGRAAAVAAATRVKQQLKSLLLRHGIKYSGKGESWSSDYRQWLGGLQLAHEAQAYVLAEELVALEEAEARVRRLTERIKELLPAWRMQPVVAALQALRGVALVTAVEMVAEVGDLTRFSKPREVMGYLGLVPSEDSTGDKRRQGSITKTGNGHARRSLVESAWAYARPPRVTRALKQRQQGLSREIIEISWRAQVRLCGRYRRLSARGKNKKKIIIAVARELCAFMWAIALATANKQVPATAV
jgi:transposase